MKKTTKIKKEALAHYDRMIKWAEKQNPRGRVNGYKIRGEIGEVWASYDCSYCNKYGLSCSRCPLNLDTWCCNGLYGDMCKSKTWGTWIKRAEKVREYIEENG